MMEYKSDNPYWIVTKICLGVIIILLVHAVIFPMYVAHVNQESTSGITKQSDKSTKTAEQRYKDTVKGENSNSSNTNSGSNSGKE